MSLVLNSWTQNNHYLTTLSLFLIQQQKSSVTQETIAWGWFAWKSGSNSSSPITLDFLNDVGGVQQIVCAERVMTCLAGNGKVYIVSYTSEAAVSFFVLLSLTT